MKEDIGKLKYDRTKWKDTSVVKRKEGLRGQPCAPRTKDHGCAGTTFCSEYNTLASPRCELTGRGTAIHISSQGTGALHTHDAVGATSNCAAGLRGLRTSITRLGEGAQRTPQWCPTRSCIKWLTAAETGFSSPDVNHFLEQRRTHVARSDSQMEAGEQRSNVIWTV